MSEEADKWLFDIQPWMDKTRSILVLEDLSLLIVPL
jgi:hypothetical protein